MVHVAATARVPVRVFLDSVLASATVAVELASFMRQRAAEGCTAVLGLATGSSPTRVYEELVRLHREEGLSFQNVVSFNLDEYYPMSPIRCRATCASCGSTYSTTSTSSLKTCTSPTVRCPSSR